MKYKNIIIASCTALFATQFSYAANVIWQSPQVISNATEVNTEGTLFTSKSSGGVDVTVNGVVFSDSPSNYSDTFNNSNTFAFTAGATFLGANDAEGQAYANLIKAGRFFAPDSSATMPMTFSNLTISQEYLIQFWVADYRDFSNDRELTLTGGVNVSGALKFLDADNTNGGIHGSYIIGKFIADDVTQIINLNANDSTQMQAVQLRAIPEPSAILLSGLGIIALMRRNRRA